jgi:hypothetical protein
MNKSIHPEKRIQDKLYKYAEIVKLAKIDGSAKALLWFYAYVFNWENKIPSWYTQRRICALTGMSPSTYHIKRKYLEDLGWITVLNRGFKDTCLVSVKVGSNDPEYEHMSWAKWHPDNENQENQIAEQEFRAAAQKVFQDDDLITGLLDSTSKRQDSNINWDDSEEVA